MESFHRHHDVEELLAFLLSFPKAHFLHLVHRRGFDERVRKSAISRGFGLAFSSEIEIMQRGDARLLNEIQHPVVIQPNLIQPVTIVRQTETASTGQKLLSMSD